MEEIKIGSHVRMAGKEMFLASVKEAESYGANVLMLYTGAPQNTRRKEIKDLNIKAGSAYAKQAGIREIVVHAPYIINLANTVKPETFELAVQFLEKEIRRTAAMRSHILVLHPGSALDAGAEAGIAQTGKLSVDETTFKSADTEKIKNLFNGTGSYAYSVATKAAMTESYAKSEAAKSNTYTKNGTYNYNYNSGNIFTDMF